MNGKWSSYRRVSIALLIALASFTTMGFTFVDSKGPETAIVADHVSCAVDVTLDESTVPSEIVDQVCAASLSVSTSADPPASVVVPSLAPVLDSTLSWEQYSVALEQTDLIWTKKFLAKFAAPYDDRLEREFVTEEYNAAVLYGVVSADPAASFEAPYDDRLMRAFVTEEYNQAVLYGVSPDLSAGVIVPSIVPEWRRNLTLEQYRGALEYYMEAP